MRGIRGMWKGREPDPVAYFENLRHESERELSEAAALSVYTLDTNPIIYSIDDEPAAMATLDDLFA